MPRVGVITQARTTSTRLPGKVLLRVGERTLLDHHLDRLEAAGLTVYVATTTNPTDDPVADLAHARGIACHRGSEHDVLSRFHETAQAHRLDVVVRVTSDCPLVDGRLVAAAVTDFLAADDPDLYLSNTLTRTFPRGLDFEVFTATALAHAHAHATDPAHREHVTPYLYTGSSGHTHLRALTWPQDKSGYRITVDTPDDLELITRLIVDHHAHLLDTAGIIDLLDHHPELVALNAHIEQKKLGQ